MVLLLPQKRSQLPPALRGAGVRLERVAQVSLGRLLAAVFPKLPGGSPQPRQSWPMAADLKD